MRDLHAPHLPTLLELRLALGTCLGQSVELLLALDDAAYRRELPRAGLRSIGSHHRHCLDHLGAFLEGGPHGVVQYGKGKRDRRVERERAFGLLAARETLVRLCDLDLDALPPRLRVAEVVCRGEAPRATSSTPARELSFLFCHLVHHQALMAVAARLQGVDPGPLFGVAPATPVRLEQGHTGTGAG